MENAPAQQVETTESEVSSEGQSSGSEVADFESWLEASGNENPFDAPESEGDLMDEPENEESEGEYEEGMEGESEESDQLESEIIKVKVDGEEYEYDISDREKLASDLQMAFGSKKRFAEAKKLRGQALDLVNKILESPLEILTSEELKSRGFDFKDIAEKYLYEQLQLERMSDQERRAHENEIRLKKYEEHLKKYEEQEALKKKQTEETQINQLKERYRESYQKQFIEAVESSKLPKAPWVFSRMAEHMKTAIRKGYKDVTPSDVAPLVKQEWLEANRATLANVSDDELDNVLPKDMADRIRKKNLEKTKSNHFINKAPPPNGQLKNSQKRPTVSSVYSFMDNLLK